MQIEIIFAAKSQVYQIQLTIEQGATVAQAIGQSDIEQSWPLPTTIAYAVFGQSVQDDYVLQAGDRIEILRPLTISPMEARRLRAAKARAKS